MGKKLLIAALAVVVGVSVVSGTRLGSHFRLWYNKSSTWANQQVAPETEIDRLKMELDNLARLDDRYFDQVTRQKLDVAKVEKKLKKDQADLATLSGDLKSMRVALKGEAELVVYNEQQYPRDKVQEQFNLDFKHFLTKEEGVKADEQHLDALKTTLKESQQKVQELATVRGKMKVRLQTLAAKLERERRLQNQGSVSIDDSRYSAINKQLDELEDRIDSMEIKRDIKGNSGKGPIRVQEEAREEQKKLDKLAEERFGTKPSTKALSN
jgi:chromosome segregation ATPase